MSEQVVKEIKTALILLRNCGLDDTDDQAKILAAIDILERQLPRQIPDAESTEGPSEEVSNATDELEAIRSMPLDGQGDDSGEQILPDLTEDMSTPAMVEACLHLLERRRDAISSGTSVGYNALQVLEANCWDLRCAPESIADTGDAETLWRVMEHQMSKPYTYVIGAGTTPQAALADAMKFSSLSTLKGA